MRWLQHIFLGLTIFSLSTIVYAASAKNEKEETKADIEFPIVESGSRLFAGEADKNEFYILGKGEPNPVIHKAQIEKPKPDVQFKSLLNISTHQAFDMLRELNPQIKLQYTPINNISDKKADNDAKSLLNITQKVSSISNTN